MLLPCLSLPNLASSFQRLCTVAVNSPRRSEVCVLGLLLSAEHRLKSANRHTRTCARGHTNTHKSLWVIRITKAIVVSICSYDKTALINLTNPSENLCLTLSSSLSDTGRIPVGLPYIKLEFRWACHTLALRSCEGQMLLKGR